MQINNKIYTVMMFTIFVMVILLAGTTLLDAWGIIDVR